MVVFSLHSVHVIFCGMSEWWVEDGRGKKGESKKINIGKHMKFHLKPEEGGSTNKPRTMEGLTFLEQVLTSLKDFF